MSDFIDRHHRLCSSLGGRTVPENIVLLRRKFHVALHIVMGNKSVVGQLDFVKEFNSPILSSEIQHDINSILRKYSGEDELYAYKNGVLIPNKFIDAQTKY